MKKANYPFLLFFISLFVLQACSKTAPTVREKNDFTHDWRFQLGDADRSEQSLYDDSDWRTLDLPHDWSIEGQFAEDAPAGIGGGALPGGVGWYRKHFTLNAADSSRQIYITFDGVYQNSEVYINGHLLGKRPNGYISFQYDLTPYLNFGAAENVLAVRCDNSDQPNSRWYSGSGIYRNVWLELTNKIHVNLWGTHITTPVVSHEKAEVKIVVDIKNNLPADAALKVKTQIVDQRGKVVAENSTQVAAPGQEIGTVEQNLTLDHPNLWSTNDPYLYTAVNYVMQNNQLLDVYETTFGVRYFAFHSDKGFSLNGHPVKIKGVCMHHDLGALGAALNIRAKERQLEILKAMGCNGIRTSHNPPSPELLELCDRMGFIVQNETFDVWAMKKVENDYAKYWDEWHVQDLTDHLLRDRNHACIFSWSIGNEILEQWDTTALSIAPELAGIVKQYMPDMPVTSGLNHPYPGNKIVQSGALDLIGFNYHHEDFEAFPKNFPGQKFIGTETGSSLNSRGVYNMPSDSVYIWPKRWDIPFYEGNPDNTCSSYDNCRAPWGSTHAATWKLMKKYDFLSGMYAWTGFDYLGEPTPYQWPSKSSYFGIVDLAGFPKDAYYMYQSEWTNSDVLHVFPHWTWPEEMEGQPIDVWAYTNYDEVELFLNGESQGVKSKEGDALHLQWELIYTPGELKAVGKRANGESKEISIHTAGEAAQIHLAVDRSLIQADGKDLAFITVEILDDAGNLVPHAQNLVQFETQGDARIVGVDNGLQTSMESFKASERKAYNGKCLAIVQAGKEKGAVTFKASAAGLAAAEVTIEME